MIGTCELCRRTERVLTAHHLIPRTLHRNRWFKKNFSRAQMNATVDLCRDCHSAIHRFVDEKTLGRELNTLDGLRAHPDIRKFVTFVAGQRRERTKTR